jgi:hypothetical protein
MKLIILKLMYRITNDRRWLLKCVDVIQQKAWDDVRKFREEVKNETN